MLKVNRVKVNCYLYPKPLQSYLILKGLFKVSCIDVFVVTQCNSEDGVDSSQGKKTVAILTDFLKNLTFQNAIKSFKLKTGLIFL